MTIIVAIYKNIIKINLISFFGILFFFIIFSLSKSIISLNLTTVDVSIDVRKLSDFTNFYENLNFTKLNADTNNKNFNMHGFDNNNQVYVMMKKSLNKMRQALLNDFNVINLKASKNLLDPSGYSLLLLGNFEVKEFDKYVNEFHKQTRSQLIYILDYYSEEKQNIINSKQLKPIFDKNNFSFFSNIEIHKAYLEYFLDKDFLLLNLKNQTASLNYIMYILIYLLLFIGSSLFYIYKEIKK